MMKIESYIAVTHEGAELIQLDTANEPIPPSPLPPVISFPEPEMYTHWKTPDDSYDYRLILPDTFSEAKARHDKNPMPQTFIKFRDNQNHPAYVQYPERWQRYYLPCEKL